MGRAHLGLKNFTEVRILRCAGYVYGVSVEFFILASFLINNLPSVIISIFHQSRLCYEKILDIEPEHEPLMKGKIYTH